MEETSAGKLEDANTIALRSDSNFVIYRGYHTKNGQLDCYHATFATGAC